MLNRNKISEIKIIVTGFLQDLDKLEKEVDITPLRWEELNMAADSIRQKLNTMYIEDTRNNLSGYIRKDEVESILMSKNEEINKLNQTITELKRSFSDVTLNISKAYIPGASGQEKESVTMEVDQEIEIFFDTSEPILDAARGAEPAWMLDNPGPHIDTLNHVITLNDKLLFIKDLFNDDTEQYRLSIQRIDEMKSFEEVLEYTREAFPDWDEESNAAYRFYMLVRRLFA